MNEAYTYKIQKGCCCVATFAAMSLKDILIDLYDYSLPSEKIAQFPLPQRDQSKLLIYKNGNIHEKKFESLTGELPENAMLVFNDTKVIQARLHFLTSTKAHIEVFLLEPAEPSADMLEVVHSHESSVWRCLLGNAKRWREEVLELKGRIGEKKFIFHASRVKKEGETFLVHLDWDAKEFSLLQILSAVGHTPLPPYIKRNDSQEDKSTYQTIFSHEEGSVAAPTAGLHFTNKVFDEFKSKNIITEYLTLHVGAGTFLPVKSSLVKNHRMHAERVYVKKSTIKKLLQQMNHGKIIAVGTTAVRTLESLYWLGKQILEKGNAIEEMNIDQWEPYQTPEDSNIEKNNRVKHSLTAILNWMEEKNKTELTGYTQIMIVPGYEFKIVDALITNFHLPKSTLLLLIAAFIGENEWKRVYDYALQHDFRFLSYGDSSLLFRK